jgi:hypothetical protein
MICDNSIIDVIKSAWHQKSDLLTQIVTRTSLFRSKTKFLKQADAVVAPSKRVISSPSHLRYPIDPPTPTNESPPYSAIATRSPTRADTPPVNPLTRVKTAESTTMRMLRSPMSDGSRFVEEEDGDETLIEETEDQHKMKGAMKGFLGKFKSKAQVLSKLDLGSYGSTEEVRSCVMFSLELMKTNS